MKYYYFVYKINYSLGEKQLNVPCRFKVEITVPNSSSTSIKPVGWLSQKEEASNSYVPRKVYQLNEKVWTLERNPKMRENGFKIWKRKRYTLWVKVRICANIISVWSRLRIFDIIFVPRLRIFIVFPGVYGMPEEQVSSFFSFFWATKAWLSQSNIPFHQMEYTFSHQFTSSQMSFSSFFLWLLIFSVISSCGMCPVLNSHSC